MQILVAVLLIIGLVVVAVALIGVTLKLLGWIVAGLIIGALGRLVVPGQQQVGWLGTILYGLGGSLIGGIVGDVVGLGSLLQFVLAVAVAAALIGLFAATGPRRATA